MKIRTTISFWFPDSFLDFQFWDESGYGKSRENTLWRDHYHLMTIPGIFTKNDEIPSEVCLIENTQVILIGYYLVAPTPSRISRRNSLAGLRVAAPRICVYFNPDFQIPKIFREP